RFQHVARTAATDRLLATDPSISGEPTTWHLAQNFETVHTCRVAGKNRQRCLSAVPCSDSAPGTQQQSPTAPCTGTPQPLYTLSRKATPRQSPGAVRSHQRRVC